MTCSQHLTDSGWKSREEALAAAPLRPAIFTGILEEISESLPGTISDCECSELPCSFSLPSPCCVCLYCSALGGQEGSAFIQFLALCGMEHNSIGSFSMDSKTITIILVEILFKVSCIRDIWESGNNELRAVTTKSCDCLQVQYAIFAYKCFEGFYKKPCGLCQPWDKEN